MFGQVMMALTPWANRTRQEERADDHIATLLADVTEMHDRAQEAIRDAGLLAELADVQAALRRPRGAP